MNIELIEAATEDFRTWIENHPDRPENALEAITALEGAIIKLPRPQVAAITDLNNLLAKALGRD